MSMDQCAKLHDATGHFSISACAFMNAQAAIKENKLVAIYKELNNKNCSRLSIKDLESYNKNLGIQRIRECLESSGKGLDRAESCCRGVSELKANLISEKECSEEFGKSVSEINEIIRKRIGPLQKKIQGLDQKLVKLDALIYFHVEYHHIAAGVTLILDQCQEEMLGDLTMEQVVELEIFADQLAKRRKHLLEGRSSSAEEHYLRVHKDDGLIIDQQFVLIESKLSRAKEMLRRRMGFSMCNHYSYESFQEIKKAFSALPLNLQRFICYKAGISQKGNLPMDHEEDLCAEPVALVERLFFDPNTALSAMIEVLNKLPGTYLKDIQSAEVVKKHCGKELLEKTCQATGKGIPEECDVTKGESPSKLFEIMRKEYSNCSFQSLSELKYYVNLLSAYQSEWNEKETQIIIQLLLDGAKKGGVVLDGLRGVYHWTWCLANKDNPNVGSYNDGAIHAVEDFNRLLIALERVIAPLPQNYSDCVTSSLVALKSEVELVNLGNWSETDKKIVLQFLLDGAKRGGVILDDAKGIYYWVWFLAHEKDSSAGGDNYGVIHAVEDASRLLLAIDKVITPKPQDYSNCLISSLADLKREVQLAINGKWKEEERQTVLQFLLEGAKRGGVALEGSKGVYYWVWFLAHEKDSNARGSNYGKINAPKDGERLLLAIGKAMGES